VDRKASAYVTAIAGLRRDSRRTVIFDSLVLRSGHDWNSSAYVTAVRDYGVMKSETDFKMYLSQRRLNCALFVKFSLIKNY
jgi:hypothetical protein